jgi:hypothetical protein
MEDEVHALARGLARFEVADIRHDEAMVRTRTRPDGPFDLLDVRAVASAQVVEADNILLQAK